MVWGCFNASGTAFSQEIINFQVYPGILEPNVLRECSLQQKANDATDRCRGLIDS